MEMERAVCLDDAEPEQLARMFPGCNHNFHLQCVDTWLYKNPVCRNKLEASFFAETKTKTNPC
ncbi:putative transcription factor C2H2 family [Helianthus anomalus]